MKGGRPAWACLLGLALLAAQAGAAEVDWSAPVSLAGLSARQILTAPAGTVVGAVGFGNERPVIVEVGTGIAPIAFGQDCDPTTASITSPRPISRGSEAKAGTTGHPGLDAVLATHATGPGPFTVKLINLQGGATYSVQLFVATGPGESVSFQSLGDRTNSSRTLAASSWSYLLGTFTVPEGATTVSLQENALTGQNRLSAVVVRALSFKPKISFIQPPIDKSLNLGDSVTLKALAIGPAPLLPKWQAGPPGGPYQDLTDDGRISGSDTYRLTINKLTKDDAARVYVLKMTSGSASLTSRETNVLLFGNAGPVYNLGPGDDVNFWVLQAYYSGGGTVHLAPGTYATSVNMYPNVTLQGSGMGVTTIVGVLTQGQYGDNMSMSDLTVSGGISASSYSQGGYPPAGIFFGAYYPYDTHNLSWKNVEVKGTNIAMQLINVSGCNLDSCNFHDNALGFSHTIYFTGDYGINMTNCIASWGFTGAGAHLDFSQNVGVSNNFTQCEFNGATGNGILNQNYNGATNDIQVRGTKIQFCGQSGGEGSGVDSDGAGSIQTSRLEYNHGNGATIRNDVGLFFDVVNGNSAAPYISYSAVAYIASGTTPNVYDAAQADGVCGVNNTADWVTNLGGAAEGTVVFTNGTHPVDGSLTFGNVGAPAAGTYPLQFIYANGTASTVAMTLTVNGVALGSVSFPPTTNSSTYAVSTVNAPLTGANNTVRLGVISPGPGTPVLNALIVNAGTPAAPDALTGLTWSANPNAPRGDMVTWVDLTWTPTPRATYYSIYRNGLPIATNVPGPTFTDKHVLGCNSGATYSVTPINAGGAGQYASVYAVSLAAYPLNLSATVNGKAVSVSCSASPNTQYYNIYRATTSGGPYTKVGTSSSTSFLDVTATSGTTYYYVMTSFNGTSESLYSPEAAATPYQPYAGPTQLLNVDFGSGALQTGTAVLPGGAGDKWNGVSATTGSLVNSANAVLSGLGLNLTDYGVYTDAGGTAMDAGTTNLMQDYAFGYNSTPNITATLTGLNSYRGATFTLVVFAAGDNVGQGASLTLGGATGGNAGSTLSTSSASRKISAGASVAYTSFNGSLAGSNLTLVAAPLAGQSFTVLNGFQLQVSAPSILPATVTGVTPSLSNGAVTLGWSAVSGADYYVVKRSTTSGGPYTVLGGATTTSFTDTTGVLGTTYYYIVVAVNSAGESLASAEQIVNTANLPAPFQSTTVGAVSAAGTINYATGTSTYVASSTGTGLLGTADSYRMVYEAVSGDCQITAHVVAVSANSQLAQSGVIIRETLAPGSISVSELLTPANAAQFVTRTATNANSTVASSAAIPGLPYWVRLRRVGNVITGSHSIDGATWTITGSATVPMATTVYLGLAVGGGGGTNSATFDNVFDHPVAPPAPPSFTASAGDGQVILTWTGALDATNYTLKRGAAAAGPFTAIAALTTTSFIDLGLTNGVTYYYTVSAANALGQGPSTAVVSATPAKLSITNSSFEAQAVADNSYVSLNAGSPTSWSAVGVNASAVIALVNPGASDGRGYGANPVGLDGNNYCQIFATAAGGTARLYQDVGSKFQAGTSYQLKAMFGKENGTPATGCTLCLFNSNLVVIASITINPASLTLGTFNEFTLNYIATGTEGGNGNILVGIVMPSTTNNGTSFVDFDNIRLAAIPKSFASYQQQYFNPTQLANPLISGPTADANGDGVSNLMAASLGLSPFASATSSLPVLGSAGDHLTLTYQRQKGATDWTSAVEVCGDLVTWQSGPAFTIISAVNSLSATTEQVTVQDNASISAGGSHFMRLKVTLP